MGDIIHREIGDENPFARNRTIPATALDRYTRLGGEADVLEQLHSNFNEIGLRELGLIARGRRPFSHLPERQTNPASLAFLLYFERRESDRRKRG